VYIVFITFGLTTARMEPRGILTEVSLRKTLTSAVDIYIRILI